MESHDDKPVGTDKPVMHITLTLEEGAVLVNGTAFATAAAMEDADAAMQAFPVVVESLRRLGLEGFKALQKKLAEAGEVFVGPAMRIEKALLTGGGGKRPDNFGMAKPSDLVS